MAEKYTELIFQLIDQTISDADFEKLQDALERNPDVRREYLRTFELVDSLGELSLERLDRAAELANKKIDRESNQPSPTNSGNRSVTNTNSWRGMTWQSWAIAATLLMLVGAASFWIGTNWIGEGSNSQTASGDELKEEASSEETESRIAGHATLRSVVGVEWANNSDKWREGDLLPNGDFEFLKGVAELDFFCGATLIVEGPALLNIESDWSVRVTKGRLRASVPPAARGFVVKAADSEIVDLGTEFALEVREDAARVEVIDGEIELRGGAHDGTHLLTGEGRLLKGVDPKTRITDGLSSASDVRRNREKADVQRLAEWLDHSKQLAKDNRLLAYFPILNSQNLRTVPNLSTRGNEFDGQIVGPVNRSEGRFGNESGGVEFGRPGARVRTRIDGEFQAFTFCCWAKIDSLDHRYNALFMADSYQNGEPHWQIQDDGRLMFSVMVDDTQTIRHFSKIDQRMVNQAGLHRVYYTEPIWDLSKSGQWFHLAAVYDPAGRTVKQFVNGKQVSSQNIVDKFHIKTLRIGPAEIGNWGQPFRKSPWFAVRNLNGTIDELAIFNAALAGDEIQELYQKGKPLGY